VFIELDILCYYCIIHAYGKCNETTLQLKYYIFLLSNVLLGMIVMWKHSRRKRSLLISHAGVQVLNPGSRGER